MEKENFLNQHKCEAVVLSCMDFRFHEDLCRYVKEEMGLSFDLVALAGGARNLVYSMGIRNEIMENFRISKNLHHSSKIVLINHVDCGAYGGSKAFKSREEEIEFHKVQLIRAKNIIKYYQELSDMEIILFFVNEKDGKPEYLSF